MKSSEFLNEATDADIDIDFADPKADQKLDLMRREHPTADSDLEAYMLTTTDQIARLATLVQKLIRK